MHGFNVVFSEDGLSHLNDFLWGRRVLFVTMEDLYPLCKDWVEVGDTVFVESADEDALIRLAGSIADVDVVVGFGGGMAVDGAKYIAWQKNCPCYLMPSAISVDACFSYPIAVRRNNKVCYVGDVKPREIVIDMTVIQSAPRRINRAGIGDLLSIKTALVDWEMASNRGMSVFDEKIAMKAQEKLSACIDCLPDIREVTEPGIHTILDGYAWVGAVSSKVGHCRFEEGSEHFFAYCVESLFPGHYLHGQLVMLGVALMRELQQPGGGKEVLEWADLLELDIRPPALGLTVEDVVFVLGQLADFVKSEGLAYSVINEKPMDETYLKSVKELLYGT